MAGAVHNHEFGVRPSLGKFPCGDERRSKIDPALDHNTRNAGQGAGLAQYDPIFEPCVVVEIVRHDARERHLEIGQ